MTGIESWNDTPLGRLRNRIAWQLANAALLIGERRYRRLIDGAVRYGLASAARDSREGREVPPWPLDADADMPLGGPETGHSGPNGGGLVTQGTPELSEAPQSPQRESAP